MIALDTNVIADLIVESQQFHVKTKEWFKNEEGPFATTHICLGETFRLLTHPRIFPHPLSLPDGVGLVERFLGHYKIAVLPEKEEWWTDLKNLPTVRGNDIFDARIAFCLKHNGVKKIATHDSDFIKYPFLKIVSPL